VTAVNEVETTLRTNVGYVGDILAALKDIPADRRLEVRAELPVAAGAIDEITIHEDGHVVVYVR